MKVLIYYKDGKLQARKYVEVQKIERVERAGVRWFHISDDEHQLLAGYREADVIKMEVI